MTTTKVIAFVAAGTISGRLMTTTLESANKYLAGPVW